MAGPVTGKVPSTFVDNDYCFACGSRNPLGLHLSFIEADGGLQTRVVPMPHWQGWAGVVHGGLQATIMDDLMSNHLFRLQRIYAVTAEVSLRFRRPVPVNTELIFTSQLEGHSGRIWQLSATCAAVGKPGLILSAGRGRFMEVEQPKPGV